MFAAPFAMGARLAGAPAAIVDAYRAFGHHAADGHRVFLPRSEARKLAISSAAPIPFPETSPIASASRPSSSSSMS